jgi:hypothetical membrane protein
VSFGLIFYCIASSPWFDWQESALSDLGMPGRSSAPLFAVALVLGALLNLPLIVAMLGWVGARRVGRWGVVLAFVGTVAFGLVGVFPASVLMPHALSAMTYFLLLPLGYILIGVALWWEGRRAHGVASILTALAAYGVMGISVRGGVGVAELVSGMLLATRSLAVSLEMIWEG